MPSPRTFGFHALLLLSRCSKQLDEVNSCATLHLLDGHRLIVQNFTVQPGNYNLVVHIVYEVDGKAYMNLGLLGMWAYSKVLEFMKVLVSHMYIFTHIFID